jgi:cell division transport system permease protein
MKLLRSLLLFIFPLGMMLSSFFVFLLVNKVVDNYRQSVASDYSIIVVSTKPILNGDKLSGVKIGKIEHIDRNKIIGDVKDTLSDTSLKALNEKLPYFCKLYLKTFPTTNELNQLEKDLRKIKYIKNVEIFENEHTKVYSLLVLTKDIVTVLFFIVLVSSFLMLLQQIRLLFFEHSKRISILQLFGASLLYSTNFIQKIMILSILLSIGLVTLLMYIVLANISLVVQPEILPIIPTFVQMDTELIKIVILAIVLPTISYTALLLKHRNKNDV